MKKAINRILLLLPAIFLLQGACTKYSFDPGKEQNEIDMQEGNCATSNPVFETDILGILTEHCTACHSSPSPAAGYDYTDKVSAVQSASDGSLLGSIEHRAGYSSMPPGYSLNDCSIEMIKAWILAESIDTTSTSDTTGIIIESNCDPDTVYFVNTVLPLVVSSCGLTNCHDEASHRDGIVLTDYQSIITKGKIKPGDPGDSEFFETLTDGGEDRMPPQPYARLDAEQIELLKTWIEQGAKNNSCTEGCQPEGATFSADVWPLMQTYCTGCHSAASPGGKITISGYDDLVALANSGTLMGAVRYESGYSPMPKNKQLSDCQVSVLQTWIDDGFPE